MVKHTCNTSAVEGEAGRTLKFQAKQGYIVSPPPTHTHPFKKQQKMEPEV